MRVSVLACLAVCVLALLGVSPAAGEISDLQCHSGNSDDNGVCSGVRDTPTNNLAPYKPTFNKLDGTSFDTDQLRLLDVFISTDLGLQQDGLLDVHRITWVANNGVGNTGRNVSRTIGRDLPAGFLPFPFAFAYTADGLYLEPRTDTLPTPNQKVTGVSATFVYRLKNEQPAQIFPNGGLVYDGNTEVWLLFQPVGGFGFTAAIADSITATAVPNKDPIYEVTLRNNTLAPGTLPNGGFGTYFLTRRVVNAAAGTVTNDLSVSSGTTLQSVGGPQAVGNTYRVQKLSNAYDAPVLGNLAVPAPDGAFLTFTLALANSDVPAAGKVFISEAVLTLKSVTPVDGSSTGVALSGTYTLDTSASSAVVGSFVEGTQKLYVRPTGTATWSALPTSQYTAGNKQVTYTLSTSDANSFGSVASLDMAVQADVPVSSSSSSSSTGESSSSSAEPSSSSSAEPSSSSSSSSAPPSSSSSSSSAPPSSSSSSSASPSSSAAPSSSSSTGPVRSSSSSSTAPAPLSSSSSTGTPSSSTGISSSTGASSSSSTAPSVDNGASTVGANGVAMALAAAAAVAALYA